MNTAPQRKRLTAGQIALVAFATPWVLWALHLITDVTTFAALGFLALLPSAVAGWVYTTRARLHLPATEAYPEEWIIMRIIAGVYILAFIPVAFVIAELSRSGHGYRADSELPASDRAYLVSIGLLAPNEKVLYFASSLTFKESGNFITDERVASYWLIEGSHTQDNYTAYAFYSQITNTAIKMNEEWNLYAHDITISCPSNYSFHLYVSENPRFTKKFYSTLTNTWQTARRRQQTPLTN